MRTEVVLLTAVVASACTKQAMPTGETTIKVASFNVRYGTAEDGDDRWALRKDRAIQQIRDIDADILGTQEMLDFQSAYVEEQFPDYARVGRDEEQIKLYYSKKRFEKKDEGLYWLSEDPDGERKTGWDARYVRMAVWVELVDRETGMEIYFLDTHLDHIGEASRKEAAELLRRRSPDHAILVGDFNARPDSEAYETLTEKFVDTYRVLHTEEKGTVHTFVEPVEFGPRIDWILGPKQAEVVDATVEDGRYEGRYPSDHFAVTATLRL